MPARERACLSTAINTNNLHRYAIKLDIPWKNAKKERSDVTPIRYTVAVYLCRSFNGRVLRHPFKYIYRSSLLRMTKVKAFGLRPETTLASISVRGNVAMRYK